MKNIQWAKTLILFIIGYLFYINIEVHYTAITGLMVGHEGKTFMSLSGLTSIWMGLLGGAIFILLGKLNEVHKIKMKWPLIAQALLGALIITSLEFTFGLIFNIGFGLDIWNYAGYPLAHLFLNQINLWHSFMWLAISPFAFWADDVARWNLYRLGICGEEDRPYSLWKFYLQFFTFKPVNYRVI